MSTARPTRLPAWQEWAVYGTLGALILSGIAWLLLDQWGMVEGEFGPEPNPAQRWLLVAHGVVAYAFLVVGGAMLPVHVRLGWHIRRNRTSGLTLGLVCVFLALTALALYYLGVERPRHLASIFHWGAGLAVLPALLIHALRGRRG